MQYRGVLLIAILASLSIHCGSSDEEPATPAADSGTDSAATDGGAESSTPDGGQDGETPEAAADGSPEAAPGDAAPEAAPDAEPEAGANVGVEWTVRYQNDTAEIMTGINSVAYSSTLGLHVAVGVGGRVLTSTDGITWAPLTPAPTTSELKSVACSGSLFVAVGAWSRAMKPTLLTSTNGTSWTEQNPGNLPTGKVLNALNAVSYVNGKFFASNGGEILYSTDGVAWTYRPDLTGQSLGPVFWSGSKYVAVGTYGVILISPDGDSWAKPTTGSDLGYNLSGVAKIGSTLVATGQANQVLVSTDDGQNWTKASTNEITTNLGAPVSIGSQLVLVGSSGLVQTSPDGTNWTKQTSPATNNLNGVIWTGTRLVAYGYSGGMPGFIMTSP